MKQLIICVLLLSTILSCSTSPNKNPQKIWWKECVFYEIYMPSFKDSNGDGYSDFKGMSEKLDYIQELGVKGIWLTPFLQSPKVDNGYDISDYFTIDPLYGDIEDFKKFIQQAHNRGIKIIMDMVVNHTSTEHKWFQESRKSKSNPYRDYYIWKDVPNNWESFFGGPAWEYDSISEQYYYHKFDVRMADLNWQNLEVRKEIKKVLRFWLDLGVDGFRMDVINFLTTDGIGADNPLDETGNQKYQFDIGQAGVKQAMREIKECVNEYNMRFIVGEIGSDKIEILKQYQSPDLLDVVFNFNFGSIPDFSAQRIFDELVSMEKNMRSYPTLFFGSHDMPRLMSRLASNNSERALALAALTFTAKGVPFIYFGEEIGMKNHLANNLDEIHDIQGRIQYKLALEKGKKTQEALIEGNKHNRDKSRSPMQWDTSAMAGFSSSKSWIKPNPDYKNINVEFQKEQSNSILNRYRQLIAWRNNLPVLQYGNYELLEFFDDCIHFRRKYKNQHIEVYINFGIPKSVKIPEDAEIISGNTKLKTNSYLIFR